MDKKNLALYLAGIGFLVVPAVYSELSRCKSDNVETAPIAAPPVVAENYADPSSDSSSTTAPDWSAGSGPEFSPGSPTDSAPESQSYAGKAGSGKMMYIDNILSAHLDAYQVKPIFAHENSGLQASAIEAAPIPVQSMSAKNDWRSRRLAKNTVYSSRRFLQASRRPEPRRSAIAYRAGQPQTRLRSVPTWVEQGQAGTTASIISRNRTLAASVEASANTAAHAKPSLGTRVRGWLRSIKAKVLHKSANPAEN